MMWGDQKLEIFISVMIQENELLVFIVNSFMSQSLRTGNTASHTEVKREERCLCDFPVPSAGVSNQREHSRPEFVLGVLNNWSHWKTPSRWVRTPAEDQGGCSKELVQDFTSSWPPHSRPYLALILSSQQLSGSVGYAVPIYRERTPLQAFNQWQTQDQNPNLIFFIGRPRPTGLQAECQLQLKVESWFQGRWTTV